MNPPPGERRLQALEEAGVTQERALERLDAVVREREAALDRIERRLALLERRLADLLDAAAPPYEDDLLD